MIVGSVHLFFAVLGVGLFFVGAWGSLRIPRYRVDLVLTLKQRLTCTATGVLLVAIAWVYFTG
jgi:hypothetical protein